MITGEVPQLFKKKMSLDIYLYDANREVENICPCCGRPLLTKEPEEIFFANITHNLSNLASSAGIYYHLWRPSELGIKKAGDLIEPLTEGLDTLLNKKDILREYNPARGWGRYEDLIDFVKDYLAACEKYPDATIQVDR